jgi:hypothetical protein
VAAEGIPTVEVFLYQNRGLKLLSYLKSRFAAELKGELVWVAQL